MKRFLPHLTLSLIALSLAFFIGCSSPSKSGSTPGLYPPDEPLPGNTTGSGASDSLDAIPVAARPEGVDPVNDVDYNLLAAETVYFDFDSSKIRPSERDKLENIAKWLNEHQGKRLMISGHTDTTGTSEYNRGLGERRALAVRTYLVGLGVSQASLFTISYGMDKPATTEKGDMANAKNRRAVPGVITK